MRLINNKAKAALLPVNKLRPFEGHPFRVDDLRKYFPRSYSAARIQETILKLLSDYQKKRQRNREER